MTMPHLMNCGHDESGWCLDCVKDQGEKHIDLSNAHHHLQESFNALKEILMGHSGVFRAVESIEKSLDEATQCDFSSAPFTLTPSQAQLWLRAQAAAYENCLQVLNSSLLKSTAHKLMLPEFGIQADSQKAHSV